MTETFSFDFFQVPSTGLHTPDANTSGLADSAPYEHVRTSTAIGFNRQADMVLSNFGAMSVGARISTDYTRTDLTFKNKGESEDVNVLTADTGVGSNVAGRGVTITHNPLIWGSTVKYTRDDQFIRMTMSKESGTSSAATQVDAPGFDIMDTNVVNATGMNATTNASLKNWPSEGWRSFGGKYDFLPYNGGWTR